ncbi:type I methionyl aminopeptidase [bacterium (Candidatus Gribaldobacteria) CG08_land_8_20_14_0_20_39_15]|uniref:Methionine aminopeptidase n=1 Tax=bacterium (Candidatus Gribaldobacteria) CG08_land_8_20_14_0_20_39_15 TaxID=2014273 RepID=A0A2M6XUX8_9BACT|nr:MAG: type I methionyl aminopeptidase [bacterium (Candidatus Gribaldobacteria) CG08_land_8_20_14_0_20_39_15]
MIPIKSEKEIAIMREGGAILARIMKNLLRMVKPGVSTEQLNRAASALIFNYKTEPAFWGYDGFPAALCTSVNNVVVHGVPSDYELKPGDVLGLDLGIKYQGYYTDMAATKLVQSETLFKLGRGLTPSQLSERKRLIKAARKALDIAIKKAEHGKTFGDISDAIQRYVESEGFNVVRDLCGHGIGKELHEEPKILNFGKPHTCEQIKQGMVFCLEPMITAGDWLLKKSSDGFGFETKDGSLSSHFEATVAITKRGAMVLTNF